MKYLAVDEHGDCYIEEDAKLVDRALIHELPVKHFKILVDEYNDATLERVTELEHS